MARSVLVTVKLRVDLDDEYTGEIPNDVEQDLQFDLEEGHVRDGLALQVLDVSAGLIDDDRPLPDED